MTTADKVVFADTNVWLAATDRFRRDYQRAHTFLASKDISIVISTQVCREYLVVATRPVQGNGLGMSSIDACRNIDAFARHIAVLEEPREFSNLTALVKEHNSAGKRIHDANIVATMLLQV